ncbi:MAG: efflux RND transporter periplasmic adaptor subunit [Halothiobacillaceae bacterium]|jgi:membrane fusion protein (multidrug efflux system)|nr:efflux RND transporter periplasmic adaptor subunit [Halothiobacillaceae bacterium]
MPRIAPALALFGLIGTSLPVFAQGMPALPVNLMTVQEQPWTSTLEAIGFLEAWQGVDVSAAEGGLVKDILFDSGRTVKAGDVLVRLDTSVEVAQLREAEAQLPTELKNLSRAKEMVSKGALPQYNLDEQVSKVDQIKERIASLQATIDRRIITAPFGGALGLRQINKGQYLQPGTAIVNLQDLSTMRIRFIVPQRDVPRVTTGLPVTIKVDAYPEREFSGRITAVEPRVDAGSGVFLAQADIPNADGLLRSGMYASLSVILPGTQQVLVVPSTAISFSLYGDFLYVAVPAKEGSGQVAQRREITLGDRRGDDVVVLSGIKAGEQVITVGGFKLSNGAAVQPSEVPTPAKPATPPRQ